MQEQVPTNLIIRYLSNQTTAEEVDELLTWVAKDNKNHKVLTEWMEAWEAKLPEKASFNLAPGLMRLNARIDKLENAPTKSRPFPWVSVAASLLIIMVASATLLVAWKFWQDKSIHYTEFKGAPGTIKTVLLADGSRITLNGNSLIKYPGEFTENKRELILEGEAFFEVKRDSLRPFIVHTGELDTEVLGTSFNIKTLPDKTIVTVATGKVKVSDENASSLLLPYQQVIYQVSTRSITKQNASLDDELAWKYPVLVFQDTPLGEVAKSIEKHYDVDVSFEKESLKNCVITGKFKNESLTKVLEAIGFSTGVQFKQVNNQYILHGKGCDK